MDFLTVLYLGFSFLALYFLFLFLLIYVQNKNRIFEAPEFIKQPSLSIVVPCFNAEKDIASTIKNLIESDYQGLKKIIVVDDCSTDNSYKIAKQLEKKYPKIVKVVQTPKNTGCAAGAKNFGAKFVKTDLIGFTDDDSFPQKDAISKMIGFFNNPSVGAVTSRVLVKGRGKFIERLQSIEYKIIAFTRKLFGFIDAIYVTNGPLSIYRKSAFDKVKGFDEANWTEDIEITWHMVSKGYKVHMSLPAKVYTVVPNNFKDWFKQRLRWNVGGLQTINKYKRSVFRVGMLGYFIFPFFVMAWVLGIFGFILFSYRIFRVIIIRFLTTKYSIESNVAILTLTDIQLAPSILLFIGISLFIMAITYNLLALSYSKEKDFKKQGAFSIMVYMLVYLAAYPALLITSVYKFLRGKKTWN